jgi:hypothetical protein
VPLNTIVSLSSGFEELRKLYQDVSCISIVFEKEFIVVNLVGTADLSLFDERDSFSSKASSKFSTWYVFQIVTFYF